MSIYELSETIVSLIYDNDVNNFIIEILGYYRRMPSANDSAARE